MLSFIIIGKNESAYLPKCIESIQVAVSKNSLAGAEIIYVDSASSDNSLRIATSFQGLKCLLISGKCSVAIGRNAGAMEAKTDMLFFVDADCEINADFFPEILDENHNFRYSLVTGIVMNNYYDDQGKFIRKLPNRESRTDLWHVVPGGVFMVKKELLEKEGYMDTSFVNAFEDYDFGLKMAASGHLTMLKKTVIANHHTEDKMDNKVIWKNIFSGKEFFRGVLYRRHLLNRRIYPIIFRNDSTAFLLFIICVGMAFSGWIDLLSVYLLLLLFRVFLQRKKQLYEIFSRFPALLVRDIGTILAFFFYYPRKQRVIYQEIS